MSATPPPWSFIDTTAIPTHTPCFGAGCPAPTTIPYITATPDGYAYQCPPSLPLIAEVNPAYALQCSHCWPTPTAQYDTAFLPDVTPGTPLWVMPGPFVDAVQSPVPEMTSTTQAQPTWTPTVEATNTPGPSPTPATYTFTDDFSSSTLPFGVVRRTDVLGPMNGGSLRVQASGWHETQSANAYPILASSLWWNANGVTPMISNTPYYVFPADVIVTRVSFRGKSIGYGNGGETARVFAYTAGVSLDPAHPSYQIAGTQGGSGSGYEYIWHTYTYPSAGATLRTVELRLETRRFADWAENAIDNVEIDFRWVAPPTPLPPPTWTPFPSPTPVQSPTPSATPRLPQPATFNRITSFSCMDIDRAAVAPNMIAEFPTQLTAVDYQCKILIPEIGPWGPWDLIFVQVPQLHVPPVELCVTYVALPAISLFGINFLPIVLSFMGAMAIYDFVSRMSG
jgi:hypothetical protein